MVGCGVVVVVADLCHFFHCCRLCRPCPHFRRPQCHFGGSGCRRPHGCFCRCPCGVVVVLVAAAFGGDGTCNEYRVSTGITRKCFPSSGW